MWMLNLLPNAFVETIIFILMAAGVLSIIGSYLLRLLPVISKYAIFVQIFGILLTAVSMYFVGGHGVEMEWRQRVAELEVKVAQAEAKASEKNVEVQTKVIEKTRVIKEKGQDIIKYIDREVVKNQEVIKFVENCPMPKEIIDQHNAAIILNQAAQKPKEDKK